MMNNKEKNIIRILKTSIVIFSVLTIVNCIRIIGSSNALFTKSINSKNKLAIKSGGIYNFDYTGGEQTFIVPKTGKYKIELWGASGGVARDSYTWNNSEPEIPGRYGKYSTGAYVSGILKIDKDKIIYVYVGQTGKYDFLVSFNGGGSGGYGTLLGNDNETGYLEPQKVYSTEHNQGAGGGGATDVRLNGGSWNNFNSLKSRILVAGGGGGDGIYSYSDNNSIAGGLKGYNGNYYQAHGDLECYGFGATQTSGGKVGKNLGAGKILTENNLSTSGTFGVGGNSINYSSLVGAGGGGSGYYGGGPGGGTTGGGTGHGGGGGSSFISGHNGCVAITEDSTEDNIKQRMDSSGNTCTDGTTDITCSYHYSNYIFTDTVMIDGAGYNWTTEKGEYVGQPQPDGSTAVGHSGNGYARITYLGN